MSLHFHCLQQHFADMVFKIWGAGPRERVWDITLCRTGHELVHQRDNRSIAEDKFICFY